MLLPVRLEATPVAFVTPSAKSLASYSASTGLASISFGAFGVSYEKGQYRAHRDGSRYVTSPKFNFGKVETAGENWAVVYVDEPFPSDTRPLRLAAVRPMPGAKVQAAGYPDDEAHMMTADKRCHIKTVSAGES
jgi:hypothetical protein